MKSARWIAAQTLIKIEKDAAFSSLALNGELKREPGISEKDAALATRLVYGVIERKITLDYNIEQYLKEPIRKLRPDVLVCIRIGAFQILFADRIPARAAVNESVDLVKTLGASYAAGLVNAVLRKIAGQGLRLPAPEGNELLYLSVKYSCPEKLLLHFLNHYGKEKTEAHLSASLAERPLFIRRNSLLCTDEMLRAEIEQEGASVESTAVDGCYALNAVGNITALSAYRKGFFHVQDMSSQIDAMLLGAKPGQTVVDCCAAPGGKSFTLAQYMNNDGRLISCDRYPKKTELIKAGAKRLGITNLSVLCADAVQLWENGISADAVLCDVPCSGFGVIGRKPEIRYKDPSQFSELPELQYAILCSGARMVKPGGALVYSTCTLNPAENEQVCERFLKNHPAYILSEDPVYKSFAEGDYMCMFASPSGGDGFFAAKFERTSP